jgi:hypothetical protein
MDLADHRARRDGPERGYAGCERADGRYEQEAFADERWHRSPKKSFS